MRRLYLLFFAGILISCSSVKENEIYGTYRWVKQGIGSKEITFEPKNFQYNLDIPLTTQKSAGTWSLKQNKIILNSYSEYRTNYFTVEEKIGAESHILITGNNNVPLYGATLIVNDSLDFQADKNGKVALPKGQIVSSIKILWIDLNRNNIYKVKNPQSNAFIIKLKENDISKEYFENEKIKVRRKYLILDGHKYLKQKAELFKFCFLFYCPL